MLSPSAKGERTEAVVVAELTKAGHTVLLPFGAHHRFDLVLYGEGGFLRVQCKTGRVRRGGSVLQFNANSSTNKVRQGYRGQVDLFAVWSPELDKTYLIPVDDASESVTHLRLMATGNGQTSGVRWAKDYELVPVV